MPSRSRSLQFAALAAGAVLAVTGCNAAAKTDGAGGSAPKDAKAFTLITPDPVGQNEFLKLAVTGAEAAAKAHGGSAPKVFQSSDAASQQQNLKAAVDAGPDVVVLVGFEFADAVAQQAQAHPDQQFLMVDACTQKTFPNVSCAVFREHEGVFLAGAEAGLLSRSGKVGAVDVLDTPQFRRYSDPFAAGAKHAAKDPGKVRASTRFVGGQSPFDDSARAKEQAGSLISDGTDHIMAAAAAGNYGVFEAAKAKAAFAYGVDVNQCPAAPGTVVDNVVKRTDVAVEQGIAHILGGDAGKTVSYGLKEGGITLTGLGDDVAASQCVIAEHEDVLKQVAALRDEIVSGKLKVDDPAAV